MKKYHVEIDGGLGGETDIEAPDLETAVEMARQWALDGDWTGADEDAEACVDVWAEDGEEETIYVPIGILRPERDPEGEEYGNLSFRELAEEYRKTESPYERWRILWAARRAYIREHEEGYCPVCRRPASQWEYYMPGLSPLTRLRWRGVEPHSFDAWVRCPCGQMWGLVHFP